MRKDTNNKLGILGVFAALTLLAILLVPNLSQYTLPSSPKITGLVPKQQSLVAPDGGLLLITVEANLTLVPQPFLIGISSASQIHYLPTEVTNRPVPDVNVIITNTKDSSIQISNLTNSLGQVGDYLTPGTYRVEFLDWRLNDSSVTVNVISGQVTSLKSFINATDYFVQSFSISDPHSSGLVVSWQPLYVQIQGTQLISSQRTLTYLEYSNVSPETALNTAGASGMGVRVQVGGNMYMNRSEWLDVSVESPISIESIGGLQLLVLNIIYLVATG